MGGRRSEPIGGEASSETNARRRQTGDWRAHTEDGLAMRLSKE
jgi:hypothetical protein